MNRRECFDAIVNHREPERLLVDFGKHFGSFHCIAYDDLKKCLQAELPSLPETQILDRMAQNVIMDEEICQRLGLDFRWLIPNWVGVRDITIDGERGYIDMWQTPHKWTDVGHYYAIAGQPLGRENLTMADIESFEWPNPNDPDMFAGLRKQAAAWHDSTDYVIGADGIKVGILQTAAQLRGYDKLFLDLALNPALAHALLSKISSLINQMYGHYMEAVGQFVQVVCITDDQGTQKSLMVSPEMFREFFKPYLKSQIETIKQAADVKVLMHCDGAIIPLLDDLIEIGVDIINPIQTVVKGFADTAALKAGYGDRITFHAAIDVQHIMPNYTVEELRYEVARRIHDLGPNGGYILAPCHNINVDIPVENVLTLFEAAREFGKYPLQLDTVLNSGRTINGGGATQAVIETKHDRLKKDELLKTLPPEWPVDLLPEIRAQVEGSQRKVVVLDDDPTGTQTVHGIPVLTEWRVESLRTELTNDLAAFYLLTNSRALPLVEAQTLNAEIGLNLVEAARQSGRKFVVVSRSDSTLRGHFPGEVESLVEALGQTIDGWIVLPYFLEGGRYTVNNIHYVAEGEWLTPAGQTEFARDKAFGYQSSDLREWVAEKMGGRLLVQDVASISIDDIRRGGSEQVTRKLIKLPKGSICIVNVASYRDLEVFVHGLLAAEAQDHRFLYRTAASFVRIRAGLGSRPILARADLNLPEAGGGLIVVGSYVPKSTQQVQELLTLPELIAVEIRVEPLLDKNRRQREIDRVADQANEALLHEQDVMIYTGRKLISGDNAEKSLAIGQLVSDGLVAMVRSISTRPRYLLAKGGITSSDVATKGLQIKRAMVLGQIMAGVPVWQAGRESRWPGLTYIVFPGNVGSATALAEVVAKLKSDSWG